MPSDLHQAPSTSELNRLRAHTSMYDAVIDAVDGRRIQVDDRWMTDYASCNYLGFDWEPEIIDAIAVEVRRWGTHPGWSTCCAPRRPPSPGWCAWTASTA